MEHDVDAESTESLQNAGPTATNNDENITEPRTPVKTDNPGLPDVSASPNGRKFKILYENMRDRFNEMTKKCEEQKIEYDLIVAEKDKTITELSAMLHNEHTGEIEDDAPKVMKMNNMDIFVGKPRKGVKDVHSNECTASGCENTNVDMIKCCMCGDLSCEDCSKVKVSKLRPIMNQCDTLFFTCQCCALLIRDGSDVNVYDVLKEKTQTLTAELETQEKENGMLAQQVKTLEDRHNTLQCLLDERETTLHETETKLVSLEQNAVEKVVHLLQTPT